MSKQKMKIQMGSHLLARNNTKLDEAMSVPLISNKEDPMSFKQDAKPTLLEKLEIS